VSLRGLHVSGSGTWICVYDLSFTLELLGMCVLGRLDTTNTGRGRVQM